VVALEQPLEGPGQVAYDCLDDFVLLDDFAFEEGVDVQAAHDVLDLDREGATLQLISSSTEN
jgi:hypothetical protein